MDAIKRCIHRFFVPTPLFPTRIIRDSLGKDNVFYVKVYTRVRDKDCVKKLLVSDKTQKNAYLLGSTADIRWLSLLFVQDKPPYRIYEGSGGEIEAFSRRLSQSFSGLFSKLKRLT